MKHSHFLSILIVCVLLFSGIAWFFVSHYHALAPAFLLSVSDIRDQIPMATSTVPADAVNTTDMPLSVPDGFTIEILADDVPGARVMVLGPQNNLWVSQMTEGAVSEIQLQPDGTAADKESIFTGLNNPHGLAFDPFHPNMLYIAEEDRLSKVDVSTSEKTLMKVADFPKGDRHVSRTIAFGPDERLYVSIGSTCDVCREDDLPYASVQVVNLETGELTPYATGLRNSVFFAWHEVDGSMWATEMGRDHLGDDVPPDEINKIEEGKNYGWPICYGNNIHDTDFDTNMYIQNPCGNTAPATIELPAHVAPLGISIIPESTVWPEDYWYDFIIAEHGSFNSTVPVGYQLVRVPVSIDSEGNLVTGKPEPFMSGWLDTDGRALGRPVGVLIRREGMMYVSDDIAGVIYKISYHTKDVVDTTNDTVMLDGLDESGTLSLDLSQQDVTLTGKARGTMFFEASFPVDLVDENGNTIANGLATATGDWMTEDFVPMHIVLHYTSSPTTPTGTLRLYKDNPSGLPEHDATVFVSVVFTS